MSTASQNPHHTTHLALDAILAPAQENRPLVEQHLQTLVASIAERGLLHAPTVDRAHRIVAGHHRLEALRRLHDQDRAAFDRHFPDGLVPVVEVDFDAGVSPDVTADLALAENQHRRPPSDEQIAALRERLRREGCQEGAGRPKKGTKAMVPAIAEATGLSASTVRRQIERIDSTKDGEQRPKRAKRGKQSEVATVGPHLAGLPPLDSPDEHAGTAWPERFQRLAQKLESAMEELNQCTSESNPGTFTPAFEALDNSMADLRTKLHTASTFVAKGYPPNADDGGAVTAAAG